jgi:hypothetical protein
LISPLPLLIIRSITRAEPGRWFADGRLAAWQPSSGRQEDDPEVESRQSFYDFPDLLMESGGRSSLLQAEKSSPMSSQVSVAA